MQVLINEQLTFQAATFIYLVYNATNVRFRARVAEIKATLLECWKN